MRRDHEAEIVSVCDCAVNPCRQRGNKKVEENVPEDRAEASALGDPSGVFDNDRLPCERVDSFGSARSQKVFYPSYNVRVVTVSANDEREGPWSRSWMP
jgi:hypothetical protein